MQGGQSLSGASYPTFLGADGVERAVPSPENASILPSAELLPHPGTVDGAQTWALPP